MTEPEPPEAPRPTPVGQPFDELFEAMWFGETDVDHMEARALRSRAAEVAQTGIRPFPSSVARVADVVREGGHAQQVEEVLSTDPVIAARVLQLASQSLFSAGAVDDLRQAVVRLGPGAIYDLVVEVALQGAYADLGGAGHAVIQHSADLARCVEMVALVHGSPHRFLYLTALLHDVGKLMLLQAEEHVGPFDHGDAAAALERASRGFDHSLLGAYATTQWGLPEPIPQVIGHHHELGRALAAGGALADGAATLRVGHDLLELAQGTADPEPHELDALIQQSAWAWLRLTTHDAEDLLDLWHARGERISSPDWKERIRSARDRHSHRQRG